VFFFKIFQLAKGLLTSSKNSVFALDLINKLLELLEVPSQSLIISKQFEVLCLDDPSQRGYLTKDAFANVRLLWKQKLFLHCASCLVAGFEQAGGL
jgi:hypothetical protein